MIKLIKFTFYILYIFFVLGLIFHTSSRPDVLGKYTFKYAIGLLIIIIAFIPLVQISHYVFKKSTLNLKGNKKLVFMPIYKVIFVFIVFIWMPLEIILRVTHINFTADPNILTIENFHPFLQHKLTRGNNRDNREIHINAYGFRGEEILKTKSKGIYRIFVLGGSTVLNRGVPYEKNFVRLVEKKLQKKYPNEKIEMLNAGVDGYSTQHSLIDYMFRIKDFNPDLIIVMQGINDLTSSCSPEGYSLGGYQPDYSHLFGSVSNIIFSYYRNKPIIGINSIAIEAFIRFASHNLYSDIIFAYKNKFPEKLRTKRISMNKFPSISSYKRNLVYMVKLTKYDNVKLVLANQPYLYNKNMDERIWFAQRTCSTKDTHPDLESLIFGINLFNTATSVIAKEYNIPFIDFASKVPKTLEYFSDDVHFTQKGNQQVADMLYEFIVENHIIDSSLP